MEIRNTLPEDMDRVMFIFEQARQFMRLNGNLHQWTGGYPSEEVLEADISSNIWGVIRSGFLRVGGNEAKSVYL